MTHPAPHPQAEPAGKQAAPPPAPWPFPVGVFDTEAQNSYQESVTLGAAAVNFPDVEIEPDGWSRGWWFRFALASAGNSATVVFTEDAPFCAVQTVLLKGTNVPQTFGPFGGYDWTQLNKWGGYQAQGDPRADQTYSLTTGSGATGGSAEWTLYIPLEISAHDALGDVQNQSDNSVYRVAVTAAPEATIYSTAPTAAPTLTLTVEQDSYSEPVSALALGGRPVMDAPPVPGTRQCWQIEDDTGVPAASHTTKITNGIGFAYRTIIFTFRQGGTSRSSGEADWPDPLDVWLGGTRTKHLGSHTWKNKIGRRFRLRSTTADAAMGPENGVRVLTWDIDVGLLPGNEARRKYFRTKDGNVYKVIGTWGSAGTLWILSNYVIARGGPANNASIIA